MAKRLFQTNITQLQNVRNKLVYSQTMTNTTIILSKENQEQLNIATEKITEAISLLLDIK